MRNKYKDKILWVAVLNEEGDIEPPELGFEGFSKNNIDKAIDDYRKEFPDLKFVACERHYVEARPYRILTKTILSGDWQLVSGKKYYSKKKAKKEKNKLQRENDIYRKFMVISDSKYKKIVEKYRKMDSNTSKE